MNAFVGWADYGMGGMGVHSPDQLEQLQKALTAGADIVNPGPSAGQGFPLRVESLESTLKVTTYSMDHIELWKLIPKVKAGSTVEQYNVISEFGQQDQEGFFVEGDLPEETDATYERKTAIIKYHGTTRRVSHVMTMINPAHGDVMAQEAVNGTMYLLRQMERHLFFARSDLSGIQWDGLEKLIEDGAPNNVIDLRGDPITQEVLTDIAMTVHDAPNFGTPSHLFLNPRNHNDLIKSFYPNGRYEVFSKPDNGMAGLDIKGYTSPAGRVQFVPDVFIDDMGGITGLVAVGESGKRPGTPTITTAATTPVDATAKFTADDDGDYFYAVVAANAKGASAAVTFGPVTVATGDQVTFGVTPAAGLPTPSYYKIYRTKVDGAAGTQRLILRVPNTAGAGELTVIDRNFRLPGTTSAFLLQMDVTNLSFKQLMPMLKVPLAIIDSSLRWMQLLYGAPVVYTPKHNLILRNIGRAPDSVGV
jgi:hypothetical protein